MSNSKQSQSSDLDGSSDDIDGKDSSEIEKKEEFYDEYGDMLPNVSRRDFLRGSVATGAVATVGSAPQSVSPVQNAEADIPTISGLTGYDGSGITSTAMGLGLFGPVGVAVDASVGKTVDETIGRSLDYANESMSSTVDSVFNILPSNDKNVVEEKEDLKTADINVASNWDNLSQIFFDRTLRGTLNQFQMTKDNVMNDALKTGIQALDDGKSVTTAQTEAQKELLVAYTRLHKLLAEDWNAIFVRQGGISDSVRVNDEYQEAKFRVAGSNATYKTLYAQYDELKSADFTPTEYTDFSDFKSENKIYNEDGIIHVGYEMVNDVVMKIPALVSLDDSNITIYTPFDSNVIQNTTKAEGRMGLKYDDTIGNTYSVGFSRVADLYEKIDTEYNNLYDQIGKAIQGASSAGVSEKQLITLLNQNQIEGVANKDNIASLQTAYASIFGETQKDPEATDVKITDANASDDVLTVETENGTKQIDVSEDGYNLVTTTDGSKPTQSDGSKGVEKGGTYTAGDGTYVVDESTGEMLKVPDGQSYKVDDITKTTTDSEGNETTTSKDSISHTETNLTSDQIGTIKDRLNVIEEQQKAVQDIKEELKNSSGGGGLFGGSGSGVLGFGIVGVLVAYIYGTQNSDTRTDRR